MKIGQVFVIFLVAFFSSQISAMSPSPEIYTPPVWSEHASAENDASIAIANNDFRLLGYVVRGTMIPGIEQDEKELLTKQCGMRMLEGFGDVVRSQDQLKKMRAMHDYAAAYNKIVAIQCLATTKSQN